MAKSFVKQSYAERLAEKLREAIASGAWPPGSKVPSIRKLADEYGVSPNTAHAALRELEEVALVWRKPSGSAFVQPTPAINGDSNSNHTPGNAPGSALSSQARSSSSRQSAKRRFRHIGLISAVSRESLERSPDDWVGRIFMAAETALAQPGTYALTHIYSIRKSDRQHIKHLDEQLDHLGDDLAGAVIFTHNSMNNSAIMDKLDRAGVPWVTINRPNSEIMHNFVSADNLAVGRTAGRCLMLERVERILMLSPDLNRSVSHTHKTTGLIEAYLHHDRPIRGIEYVRCAGMGEKHGYQMTRQHLRDPHHRPQAIFTTGDRLAAGALRACRDTGLDVPGQVSVIGSTGLDIARYTFPSMTVVPQPMEAMGRAAGEMLLRMIQTGERRLPGRQIPGRLILRESTKLSDATRRTLMAEGLVDGDADL